MLVTTNVSSFWKLLLSLCITEGDLNVITTGDHIKSGYERVFVINLSYYVRN